MNIFSFTIMSVLVGGALVSLANGTWINITSTKQIDLGPYDALSVYNKTTFILSGQPCTTGKTVSLSIVRLHDKFKFIHFKKLYTDTKPIRIDDDGFGAILSFNLQEHISENSFHINIKPVIINTTSYKVIDYLPGSIIEVRWSMDRSKCKNHIGRLPDSPQNVGFLPSKCTHSMRHGDFSTICVLKSQALYMSVLNICDIPYSVKIVSMLNEDEASVHTYTSEKFDKNIQITHDVLGGHCGLQVKAFHGHKRNHEKQHIRVDYVCTNVHSGKNMTVLDDSYYTVYGMLCGLSNCTTNNPTTNHRTCSEKIYNKSGKKVNALITTKLEVCQMKNIKAQVQYSVEGFSKTFSQEMTAMVDMLDNTKRKLLDLGTPEKNRVQHRSTGFMEIDGGEVSLYVSPDHHNSRKFHVMLLRHFPDSDDRFPLMHDDVIVDDADKPCQAMAISKKGSSGGVQPWLLILAIILGILLIIGLALFLRWWRGRQHVYSNAEIGLPYHIELEDDQFSIDQY